MTTHQAIWLGVIIWVFGLACFTLGCWWAGRERADDGFQDYLDGRDS